MKPLKPGDKVAVYDGIRTIGTVKYMYPDGAYDVRLRSGDIDAFHRKQLRLITKKEKPAPQADAWKYKAPHIPNMSVAPDVKQRAPRRVWVSYYNNGAIVCHYNKTEAETYRLSRFTGFTECVEFVEVMKEGGE